MTEKFERGTEQLSQKPQENTTKKELLGLLDTTEKMNQAKNVLSEKQIQAIGEQNILNEQMDIDKLTVIGYMLGVEDIQEITPEKLVEMSTKEINQYIASNY